MRLLLTFWKPLSFHLSHPLSVVPQSHEHPSCVLISLSSLLSPCPLSSLRHLCTGPLTIQEPLNVPWLSVPHSRCLGSGSSYSGQSSLSSSLCLSPFCACCHCLSLPLCVHFLFTICVNSVLEFCLVFVFEVCLLSRPPWWRGRCVAQDYLATPESCMIPSQIHNHHILLQLLFYGFILLTVYTLILSLYVT